jgi:gliding motility-associated transport system permease protein
MSATITVFKRELGGYFSTPLAYVFICIFLFAAALVTFYWGNWFEQGRASLDQFFVFHPWLYLFLVPAVAMRLWAEEYKTGTVELIMTLPLPLHALVLGKFLAAWAFTGLALALTFPMWITTNVLGHPDNGVILAGYIGSFLMAGGYLAIGSCLSAVTNNQVIAFVLAALVAFLLTISGLPLITGGLSGILPAALLSTFSSLSFLAHFQAIRTGVIDFRDVVFFLSVIGVFLAINAILVDLRRAS